MSQCTKKACDLSGGVVSDPRRGTITIRLTEPDPEFLHKLAYPFTYVAPADHPFGSETPPPGTGPYRLDRYRRSGTRLVRNPHFRVWSQDARPDGFPDEIVVRARDGEIKAQVAKVERGAADLVVVGDGFGGPLTPAQIRELRLRGRGQLFSNAIPEFNFMQMNTNEPPFDDVRVRQALNYAVDRRAFADLAGGPDLAAPTCQFLPPGFPNYAPACRYTIDPQPSGAWTAPDLARAQRLIDESGTAGMDVLIWAMPDQEPMGRFFVSLLRRLGYDSTLEIAPDLDTFFERAQTERTRPEMTAAAWWADTGAASQFAVLFKCGDPFNGTGFCDRGFDARVDAALAARGPEAAARWQDAYSYLADAAPAVPLVNHRTVVLLSRRVGNHQHHPIGQTLLDQLWVR